MDSEGKWNAKAGEYKIEFGVQETSVRGLGQGYTMLRIAAIWEANVVPQGVPTNGILKCLILITLLSKRQIEQDVGEFQSMFG